MLLGPIAGVMLAAYYLLWKAQLEVAELFRMDGIYAGRNGTNWAGIGALVIGILPNLPGSLAGVGLTADTAPVFATIYIHAWFVRLFVAGAAYLVLLKILNKWRHACDGPGPRASPWPFPHPNTGEGDMPKAYWTAHLTVTGPEPYKLYAEAVTEAFHAQGARVLARGDRIKALEGKSHLRDVVIELPRWRPCAPATTPTLTRPPSATTRRQPSPTS